MTIEDLLIAIMLLVFICLLIWILARDTATPHSGATEPSRLPPPPEPRHSGPWYLHIMFLDTADTPDLWLKADDIQYITGDPKTKKLCVMFPSGGQTYENVDRYTFEQLSQMGDWLISENLESQ